MAAKKPARRPKNQREKEMPANARERLAGLMLDALDFGGKGADRPRLRDNPELLARGRSYGITEAGTRVAADLKKLVEEILHHQAGDPVEIYQRDTAGILIKDSNGRLMLTGEKRHKTVDEILIEWRGRASDTVPGQKASIAQYATFMRNGQRSDYESRVLSLYKALEGPYTKDHVSRETVKRERTAKSEMDVNVLINLYNRAVTILSEIDKKAEDVKKRLEGGGRGKNKIDDLIEAELRLSSKVGEMFEDEEDPAATEEDPAATGETRKSRKRRVKKTGLHPAATGLKTRKVPI